MQQYIITYLPYLLSLITIYQVYLAGNKAQHAWLVGLANQALWSTWIYLSANYGLFPMNIAMWILYFRNHVIWNQGKEA